jgi:hypothetical protein
VLSLKTTSYVLVKCVSLHFYVPKAAYHSSKKSYCLCKKDYKTEEECTAQQGAAEPLTNGQTNERMKKQLVFKLNDAVVASDVLSEHHCWLFVMR